MKQFCGRSNLLPLAMKVVVPGRRPGELE